MSFIQELKRRNVFKVGLAYVLMGWVVLQGADFALDLIDAPNWVIQAFSILVIAGLPIALFLAWAFEMTPEGIKREHEVDRTQSITPQTGRKLNALIIGVLAVIIVLMGVERVFFAGQGEEAEVADVVTETDLSKSIAVLPFDDMSQAGDQVWFADGLAEEILNALAKAPDLKVTSRTASFRYRDSDLPLAQIADELGVAHIVEGSVRSSGDRIRVTAQLIRAEDGFHLWSENYDRNQDDMIAIQEDLATSIAQALETGMDPEALEAMAQAGTRSVDAYMAYLRGLAYESAPSTRPYEEMIVAAREQYELAVDHDPGFAEAYWRLAALWQTDLTPTYIWHGSLGETTEGAMAEFEKNINLAIENSASESDLKGYQAAKAEMQGRLRDAIRLYREYLETRPNDNAAWGGLYTTAMRANDRAAIQIALDRMRTEGERDLNSAIAHLAYGYHYEDPSVIADYGLERMEKWPEVPGLWYQVHRALIWAGRAEEAASLARRFDDDWININLVRARQACIEGRTADAEALLSEVPNDFNETTTRWLMYKMLGRDHEAAEAARPITESVSDFQSGSLLLYRQFDPTPHPRVMALMEREGVLRPPPREIPFKCPPPEGKSIAVLPFVNMSSDPEQEYFSDGISEEILNGLVKLEDLKVAGRTSSFSFKGQNEDLRTIGESLGVNHILEGSVRKAGDQVRITAQLIQVSDGFHLWSETYTRELNDIFAVQDEISQAIVEALEVTLSDEEAEELVAHSTDNVEAYNKYLQGRQLWHQRGESNLKASALVLQEAVSLDPDFALAWAALADAYVLIPEYNLRDHDAQVWIPRARDAVNRALEIDPEMAQALTTRGYIRYQYDFDWDNAEKDILQAIKNEPTYPTAHQWYGEMLAARDRDIEAGLANIRRAADLDPLAPIMWHVSGSLVGEMERFEEAIRYYNRSLEISPNFLPTYNNLTWLYIRYGKFEQAEQMWQRFQELSGFELPEDVPTMIDAARDPVAKQAFLEEMNTNPNWQPSAINKANFYMFLGETELALETLISAKEQGDPYAVTANRMAIFDPLRDDPRFIAHLESMNIEP